MDLLTQAALGAALAQAAAPGRDVRVATVIGAVAGVAADLDALVGSAADPLLALEAHRHVTHALAFVPVGAAIVALVAWPLARRWLPARRLYAYALLGYAPSGLLDACTSYGTHLFWPFSTEPVAWNLIAVVDPVFTLSLLLPLALGWRRRRPTPARVGIAAAAAYLALAFVQHERAEAAAFASVRARGHVPDRLLVKPTLGNLLVWRSLYLVDGRLHADAVRLGPPGPSWVREGASAPLFDPARDLAWAPEHSRARRDAERFVALSRGFAVRHPERPSLVGDGRYAMLPDRIAPLWGIELDASDPEATPRFVTDRRFTRDDRREMLELLFPVE